MRLPPVHRSRRFLLVASVACFALAVFLGLVAVDVARWRGTLAADEVRLAVSAPSGGPRQTTLAPFSAAERLLGIEDDLAFRRMLRLLRSTKLQSIIVSDPELAIRRTELTEQLESIVVRDPDPVLRSRAASVLGVLGISSWYSAPGGGSQQDRSELLLGAIASFEQAIALDPGNDDAKFNLQLMLRRDAGLLPIEAAGGRNPTPGGRGARGAGAGAPGSGY